MRTWARIGLVCAIGVLTTGVLAEPAVGRAATATAIGLTNFGLAVGTGPSAPSKHKDLLVSFIDAADASVEFRNEKSDSSGNVIAGTSPIIFDEFGGESTPCTYQADGFCHLDVGQTDAAFDIIFKANSAVEAYAKFSYILRDGTTVLQTGSIVVSVLDGPDIGDTSPRTTFAKTCPTPGPDKPTPCAVGDEIDFTVKARNVGSDPIAGVRVRFEFSSGIKPVSVPTGDPHRTCTYSTGPSTHITVVVCELPDETLEPRGDFAFDLSPGAEGTIDSDAFGDEEVCFEVTALQDTELVYPDSGPCQLGSVGVLSGASAALKRLPDVDPQDNWGWVAIKNVKTQVFDLAAIGANVSGDVGDKVSAQVGIANKGTGAIDTYRTRQPATRITVTIPTGIQVDTAPPGCSNQTSYWLCSQPGSFLGAGQSFMYTFKLRIVSHAQSGQVSVREPGVDTRDGNPANDEASLKVGGSGLPVTGGPTLIIVAIGAALLLAGLIVLRYTPRFAPRHRRKGG
jgi:hypothetical protein